jgi:hypothetical protein
MDTTDAWLQFLFFSFELCCPICRGQVAAAGLRRGRAALLARWWGSWRAWRHRLLLPWH